MNARDRAAIGAALLDLFALVDPPTDAEDAALRAAFDWASADDAFVAEAAVKALRVSTRELAEMARHLTVAVRIGSDHFAAYQSVQADRATEGHRRKAEPIKRRVQALHAQGVSVANIAKAVDRTPERVRQILREAK